MITRSISFLVLGILLAACSPEDVPANKVSAVCRALVGPIRYNTADRRNQRYAAYLLSLDLAERNRIGRALRCPQYR